MAKRKPKPRYGAIEFDSTEELHFYHWCVEAQQHGVLQTFRYRPAKFDLSDSVVEYITQVGKSGKPVKPKRKVWLREATYSADFWVEFASYQMSIRCGFQNLGEFIDVKPAFHRADSRAAKFSILQKWVYQRFQVLVVPIVPLELFVKTWMPAAAMLTPTGRLRDGKSVQGMKTVQEFLR